jgi:hypothetical protein
MLPFDSLEKTEIILNPDSWGKKFFSHLVVSAKAQDIKCASWDYEWKGNRCCCVLITFVFSSGFQLWVLN